MVNIRTTWATWQDNLGYMTRPTWATCQGQPGLYDKTLNRKRKYSARSESASNSSDSMFIQKSVNSLLEVGQRHGDKDKGGTGTLKAMASSWRLEELTWAIEPMASSASPEVPILPEWVETGALDCVQVTGNWWKVVLQFSVGSGQIQLTSV